MGKISELVKLKCPLILASSSPRRKKLLRMLGFDFQVVPPDVNEENLCTDIFDYSLKVISIAKEKALNVARRINYESIILAADTIVVLDGNILTKPVDDFEASVMLKNLATEPILSLLELWFYTPHR